MVIVTQLVGLVAFIILATSFTKKSKKRIIKYQILASTIFTLHYILLNAVGGIISSIIILLRNILFYKYGKHQKKLSYLITGLFIISGIIFYDYWYSFIPIVGASICTLLMSKKKRQVLVGGIINSSGWVVYNAIAGSYIGIITESIVILTSYKSLKKMKK